MCIVQAGQEGQISRSDLCQARGQHALGNQTEFKEPTNQLEPTTKPTNKTKYQTKHKKSQSKTDRSSPGVRGRPHNHDGPAREPDPGLLWHPRRQLVRGARRPQVDQGEHRRLEVVWVFLRPRPILMLFHFQERNHSESRRWRGKEGDSNRRQTEHRICAHPQSV